MSFAYLARPGRGCCFCEDGVPIEKIEARGGHIIRLCLSCVMRWFPGKDVTWWEERHAPFADPLDEALKYAQEYEKRQVLSTRAERSPIYAGRQ